MILTEEEYIVLINESPLFDMNKDDNPALYKSTKYEFLKLLSEYYKEYVIRQKQEDFHGVEWLEAALECIKGYDKSRGRFLHLFNSVMKQKILRSRAREAVENRRQGIKLSQRENKTIRKIMAYVQSKGARIDDEHTRKQIAEYLNLPVEDVVELININRDAVGINNIWVEDDDGTPHDLLISEDVGPEERAVQKDNMMTWLRLIDAEFRRLQDRTKRVMRRLLTARLLNGMDDALDYETLVGLAFVDEEMVRAYFTGIAAPTAKEVAEEFGLLESSVSRTYKTFIQRVKQ